MSTFEHVQMQSDALVQRDRQFFRGQANELQAQSGQIMLAAANQVGNALLNQREMAIKEAQAQASIQLAQQEQEMNQLKLQAMAQIDEADMRREQLNALRNQNRLTGAQADQAEANAKRYAAMSVKPDPLVELFDNLDAENVAKGGYRITSNGLVPFKDEAEQAAYLKLIRRQGNTQVDSKLDFINAFRAAEDAGLTEASEATKQAYREQFGEELVPNQPRRITVDTAQPKVGVERFTSAYNRLPETKRRAAFGGDSGWSEEGKALFYDAWSREYDQKSHKFNRPMGKEEVFLRWMQDFASWPPETRRIALRMMGMSPEDIEK